MITLFRAFLSVLALFALSAPASANAQQWEWDDVERIVAIGDLHGDYEKFAAMLRTARVLDADNRWSGGATHLVQLGDVPDRGPDTRRIIDLLRALEAPARRAGGRVHALIGNHEAMNVEGDLRYVHPGEYAAFADARSARRRDAYYRQTLDFLRANPPAEGLPVFDEVHRSQWNAEHPLGWIEHRIAWSPEGEYGRWVAGNNAVIRINDMLFMHGGIGPAYANADPDHMNRAVRAALEGRPDTTFPAILTDGEGPLWYRGLANHPEDAERAHLEALLARHRVARIVIGHSKVAPTVFPRFEGRVIATDVAVHRNQTDPHALLIVEGGQLTTVHRGQHVPLTAASAEERCAYLERVAALDPVGGPMSDLYATQCQGAQPAAAPETVD